MRPIGKACAAVLALAAVGGVSRAPAQTSPLPSPPSRAAAAAIPAAPTADAAGRPTRHALVIGIGAYRDPRVPALRGVDAFVHVVRAFESDTVPHPEGSVDPRRDAEMLELELILADHSTVERRLERLEANIKKAHKPEDVRVLFFPGEPGQPPTWMS